MGDVSDNGSCSSFTNHSVQSWLQEHSHSSNSFGTATSSGSKDGSFHLQKITQELVLKLLMYTALGVSAVVICVMTFHFFDKEEQANFESQVCFWGMVFSCLSLFCDRHLS